MAAINRLLWLAETRLKTGLSLEDAGRETGLSPTHVSRLFPLLTGHTLSGYMRRRRLSEAARALAGGAPDILQLALESGYGSHEAFTRAFRAAFGVTPDAVRKLASTEQLELMEPIRMSQNAESSLSDPVIEDRPAMTMIGLSERHAMSSPTGIPAQWARFAPWLGNIPGAVDGATYGVGGDMQEGEDQFQYITAVEAAPGAEAPEGLGVYRIPAQRIARFAHHGHVSAIPATCAAIYGNYLPAKGLEPGDAFSFIEYYGPDFDAARGTGTIEIWIGLKTGA